MVPNPARPLASLSPIVVIGAAFLMAACGAGPGAPTGTTASAPVATPTIVPATATPVPTPTTLPSETPGTFTTDDVAIAKIVKDSAAEAIPKLETVAKLSLEQQTALFLPVRMWITVQLEHVAALSPSGCTKDAVDLFNDGMGRYRNIAQDFLDWREWGAAGLPYTLSEPKRAAKLLGDAVTALGAHCPLPA
jgi:hypothetical protein